MSPRKRRTSRPGPVRERTLYEDLSPEMAVLKQLLVGPRAAAFLAYRRLLDWLPETVADRFAQAVLALRESGDAPANVAAYLLMPFVTGVARARLATRPIFRLLTSQLDEEAAERVMATVVTGAPARHTTTTTEWRALKLERRIELDYLRELGEIDLATQLDDESSDWHDLVDDGARALFGVALDAIRHAVVMPDGTTPSARQFDRALSRHIDALDQGVTPPTFRQLLDDVAAEDGHPRPGP